MRMTDAEMQADYDERKQRWNDGVADDEDRRLCKEYERHGFRQSRLIREDEAKQAARDAHAGLSADEQGELPRVTQRDTVDDWRRFAELVNAKLGEDAPVLDPATATKDELVKQYGNYARQARD